jgi:GTP 3',8-cyclase
MTKFPDLVDPFGRHVSYLRVSVTDRCDFRCTYCMSENMTFLPKKDLLTLEELDRLCSAFIEQGVKKIRLTGGEPLVRKGIMSLVESMSRHLRSGALEELTLTTNGSQLAKYAGELVQHGVKRINVSVDTLDEQKFRRGAERRERHRNSRDDPLGPWRGHGLDLD